MGRPAKGCLSSFHPEIGRQTKTWRTDQFEWGAKTLRAELKTRERFSGLDIPSRSSIGRFLKKEGFIESPPVRRAGPEDVDKLPPAQRAHQRWQVDAKGNEQVDNVGAVGIINTKDVHTHLHTGTFPALMPSKHGHPTADDYRIGLRLAFCEFGLPEEIQCDHDSVFYDNQHGSPFPTLMHLWLVALGIRAVFSRARRPMDQGQVERQHQTIWSQVQRRSGFAAWVRLFDHSQQRRHRLNHRIPCESLGNKAPMVCFPEAAHSGRWYRPESEKQLADMARIDAFLAERSWKRTVSKNGSVKIAKQSYFLKGVRPGQELTITYDAFMQTFGFHNQDGLLLDHRKAKGLEMGRIMGEHPLRLPAGFQFQLPFDTQSECLLRLYETPPTTS